MGDSSESPTWPVWNIPWDQTVVILSLPPFFSFFFILDWDWERFGELFFSHCACPLKWIHCVWKHPAPQRGRRGERLWKSGARLLRCVLAHACEMWCVDSTRDLPRSLYTGPVVRAQRSRLKKERGEKKGLSIAIFPNELCKCVSRRYGNTVRAQFGSLFPWQRSASEGGILGAITEREFGGCDGE